MLKDYLNKGISTPVGILIIVITFILGVGILVYQQKWASENFPSIPILKLSKKPPLEPSPIELYITLELLHLENFDFTNKSFEGETVWGGNPLFMPDRGLGKKITVITTDSTYIYTQSDYIFREEGLMTFSEFKSLIDTGRYFPITIKGILESGSVIEAIEVIYFVQ